MVDLYLYRVELVLSVLLLLLADRPQIQTLTGANIIKLHAKGSKICSYTYKIHCQLNAVSTLYVFYVLMKLKFFYGSN